MDKQALDGLKQIIHDCHELAAQKGWWDKERDMLGSLMLVVTELAEAAEEYREHGYTTKLATIEYDGKKPVGFVVEIADAIIRIFDLIGGLSMTNVFVEALHRKFEYNKTRGYRHGNKVA
jgi:hypothetical protein